MTVAERPGRYESRTTALLGLQVDLVADFAHQDDGTQVSLEARTAWPPGLRLFGRVVEAVLLNPREANRELANLKAVVERGVKVGER